MKSGVITFVKCSFNVTVAFSFLSDKTSDHERLSAFIFLVAIRSLENADNNLFVGRC